MKSIYRDRLRNYQKYIKLGVLADQYGIPRSNLSRFIKSSNYDYYLSIEKLDGFIRYIQDTLDKINV